MGRYAITGANRGLGFEFVRQLAERGHEVVALCRNPDGAERLTALAKDAAITVRRGDVTDEDSLRAAAQGVEVLDGLINNAGVIGEREPGIAELSVTKMAEVMEINVYGVIRATRVFLPALLKGQAKRLVNITSLMGSVSDNGGGRYSGYRISKAAVNMLTRNLGIELANEGFTVLALHPGWVATGMGGPAAPLSPEESVSAMIATIESKGPDDSGAFFDRGGKALPY